MNSSRQIPEVDGMLMFVALHVIRREIQELGRHYTSMMFSAPCSPAGHNHFSNYSPFLACNNLLISHLLATTTEP